MYRPKHDLCKTYIYFTVPTIGSHISNKLEGNTNSLINIESNTTVWVKFISTTTTYCHLSSTPLQFTKNYMLMWNFQIREQPDLQTEFYTALYLKSTVLISKSGKLGDIMSNPDSKHYLWVDSSNSNAQNKWMCINFLSHLCCSTVGFSRKNQIFSICEIITGGAFWRY